MKIRTEHGYITFYEIDPAEEGWEDYKGWVIDRLFVNQESRGEGHARKLLEDALSYMDGITTDIYLVASPLDMSVTMSRLIDLYESYGFEVECSEMPHPLMRR